MRDTHTDARTSVNLELTPPEVGQLKTGESSKKLKPYMLLDFSLFHPWYRSLQQSLGQKSRLSVLLVTWVHFFLNFLNLTYIPEMTQ